MVVAMKSVDEAQDKQLAMYRDKAELYDRLVSAEDCEGHLGRALAAATKLEGARALDVGCGTGRVARVLLTQGARLVLGVDRAPAMLEVARRTLAKEVQQERLQLREADARTLEVEPASFDVATAGWCFGHFRHWMPEGWRDEVLQALDCMQRAVRVGGTLLVLETLGTGHSSPRFHQGLEEYFALLEAQGFERSWFRTDYQFASVREASEVLGAFFPASLVALLAEEQWARVPECTGLWRRAS